MPSGIRVLVVDDHDMVRRGLAAFLDVQPDLELVAEAHNGARALQLCQRLLPDVVLMDLIMPEMDGITAVQTITATWPEIRVIALTSFPDKELVQRALQAGAVSYLLKNITAEELATAIRAAYRGRATVSPEVMQALVQNMRQPSEPTSDLTSREAEVLELLVEGLSNPEIATRLSVSRSTARAHVSNILAKLGAENRAEAIALAFRHRLVT
jgi:NarL family two-component system response regulator LiaR